MGHISSSNNGPGFKPEQTPMSNQKRLFESRENRSVYLYRNTEPLVGGNDRTEVPGMHWADVRSVASPARPQRAWGEVVPGRSR